MYICIHIYMYTYIHIHINMYICICLHLIYTYVFVYIWYIYIHIFTHIFKCTYICICVYMPVYIYIYLYINLHLYAFTSTYAYVTLHYINTTLLYITLHYIHTYTVKPASWHQVQENMHERCNLSQLNALFAERKTHIPWAQNWGHKFGSGNMVAPFLGPESGICFGATKHKQELFNTGRRRAPADASWQQHISVILRGYMPAKLALLLI